MVRAENMHIGMDKKICCMCKKEKNFDEFYKNITRSSGIQNYCKQCNTEYVRRRYLANKVLYRERNRRLRLELRDFVDDLKRGRVCVDCGICYSPWIMDFHHLGDKDRAVSIMVTAMCGREKLMEEISKCELVCANCHRDRTHKKNRCK